MKTYIKKNYRDHYISYEEELDPEYVGDGIGTTYQDYLNNMWVLLSDEQVQFHEEHPEASILEVINMELNEVQIDYVAQAKRNKIDEIEEYDKSNAVNSFTIGSQEMWLTVEERQQLMTQLQMHQAVGRETMTKWFNGQQYTFTLQLWQQMLIALEIYAGDALNVTEAHKAAVESLTTVAEIEAYDYTQNYPEKLIFNVL